MDTDEPVSSFDGSSEGQQERRRLGDVTCTRLALRTAELLLAGRNQGTVIRDDVARTARSVELHTRNCKPGRGGHAVEGSEFVCKNIFGNDRIPHERRGLSRGGFVPRRLYVLDEQPIARPERAVRGLPHIAKAKYAKSNRHHECQGDRPDANALRRCMGTNPGHIVNFANPGDAESGTKVGEAQDNPKEEPVKAPIQTVEGECR